MNAAPRRFVSLGVAALFQVLLVYGLYVGLLNKYGLNIPNDLIVHIVPVIPPEPPMPAPAIPGKPIYAPSPIVPMPHIPTTDKETAPITLVVAGPNDLAPAAQPIPHAAEVFARVDPRHRNPQPDYPATSKRLNEEGTTILSIFIDERGSVTQAQLLTSSGSSRLDDAAMRGVTTRGQKRWHYLPAMKDGIAIGVWQTVAVKWELKRSGY